MTSIRTRDSYPRRGPAVVSLACAGTVAFSAAIAACGSFDGTPAGETGPDDSSVYAAEAGDGSDATTDALVEDGRADGGADADAATDAPPPCLDDAPFKTVTALTDLGDVTSVRLTKDGATAFTSFIAAADNEDVDEGPFPKGALLYNHSVDTLQNDTHPAPVDDPLVLFYEHGLPGEGALVRATRAQVGQKFVNVLPVAFSGLPSGQTREPHALANGSVLYFTFQPGAATTRDIYRAELNGGVWAPGRVNGVSTGGNEGHPVVTADELTIFFSHADIDGQADVWMATRASTAVPFPAGLPVAGLDSTIAGGQPSDDRPTWLSADRCTLFMTSNRSGAYRAYAAKRR